MANNDKKIVSFSAKIDVVERVSTKGNVYRVFEAEVNGRTVQLGFVSDSQELGLLKAGVKLD